MKLTTDVSVSHVIVFEYYKAQQMTPITLLEKLTLNAKTYVSLINHVMQKLFHLVTTVVQIRLE